MTYAGRTWSYEGPPLALSTPPAGLGPGWRYDMRRIN